MSFRLCLLGIFGLLMLSSQTPVMPSAALQPLHVSMPVSTARIQITGLPAQCETATLQLQNSDPLLPGSQSLTRAVALLKASASAPDYGVEFLLGPGMAPQRYAAKQLWLSCATSKASPPMHWQTPAPVEINRPDTSLKLNPDFEPVTAPDGALPWGPRNPTADHDLGKTATLCRQAASARFFQDQGENYALNFNGGAPVTIIGRKTWGAGPPITAGRSWQPYPAKASVCSWYRRITVHHTHTALSIQALQIFHQNQADPKADIAYHFYIPASGEIYEARPLGFQGSHSEGDNGANLGIVLNGDFTQTAPSPQQMSALRNLLTALRCPCGFSDGIWTHQQRKHLKFKGDPARSTECPGQELALEVYGLARELGFGPITVP